MASENQIKHKIVISGEQEYKRAMREMSSQLKEAKSEVKATSAELEAQGKNVDGLTAQMRALELQRQKEADMLHEMQRHLVAVTEATGAESDEAVKLRTRINAMRAEVAQTSSQLSRLTGELDEAREAAEGLGSSSAADGIRSLGTAAEGAESDLDGILGKLGTLGQGFTIGIGMSVAKDAYEGVKNIITDAIVTGWNEAVNSRIEYNQIGVKTGTAGGATNDYMSGMLDRLKIQNPNRATSEWIDALAAAYTQFPAGSFDNAERLNEILKKLDTVSFAVGTDLPGVINIVGRLKDTFGESEEDLGDVLYWLGTSKAGNEGITVLEQYASTWSDIGMNAINAAGALVLARISGVSNLNAVGKAAKEAETFILTDKEGLDQLGLLADDLPIKFQKGGEDAKAAMTLLMKTFLGQDQETQNELGGKIFGQENWERYGTRIAEAIAGGYETELTADMKRATKDAQDALTNDIESQIARLEEEKNQVLGQLLAPMEALALAGLSNAADAGANAILEGKSWAGAVVKGFFYGVNEEMEKQVDQDFAEYGFDSGDIMTSFNIGKKSLEEPAEKAGEEAAETAMGAYARGFAKNPRMRDADEFFLPVSAPASPEAVDAWVESVLGAGEAGTMEAAAEKAGEEAAETVLDAYARGFARNPRMREADAFEIPAEQAGEDSAGAVLDAYARGFARNPRMRDADEFILPVSTPAAPESVDAWVEAVLGTGGPETMEAAAEEAGEETAETVLDAYARGIARNPRMREADEFFLPVSAPAAPETVDAWVEAVLGTGGSSTLAAAAEEAGKEDAGTVLDAYGSGMEQGTDFESVKAQVENLNAQIAAALNAGDNDLAEELQAKRNALIPTMMLLAADAKKTGEDAKTGFDDEFKGITVTVEDTMTGALTVLDGHISEFYQKGWSAGDAFVRGYRDAQGIESPSKVMAEAAGYTMEGLFQELDRGAIDLEERAASLSRILESGARDAGSAADALAISGSGISASELRSALDGMAVMMNGEVVGELTEKSVSQASAQRAAGTVSGRANKIRSW